MYFNSTINWFQEQNLLKQSSNFFCLFKSYISEQVATYLNIKRGNKEQENSLKRMGKKHFSQSYMNMNGGFRIDILVTFNYERDICSSLQVVGENGHYEKLKCMKGIKHIVQIWKYRD